jgi:7,8-dihydropterin-6-yl-methyl-4-(beta-D-ribofuranosyl)aminobenzene 5'-phosphate synthase
MGIELSEADLFVLSHGHFDHGGGIPFFLERNAHAKLYIHKQAFNKYYVKRGNNEFFFIGIPENIRSNQRVVLTEGYVYIDDELSLYSDVAQKEYYSTANRTLFREENGITEEDRFMHEQNLIVSDNTHITLIAGCAHRGIVNIMKRCREIKGRWPDVVIGGFHLYNPTWKQTENPKMIAAMGGFLKQTGALFYTGHCTGEEAFLLLKKELGERLRPLSTGSSFTIP